MRATTLILFGLACEVIGFVLIALLAAEAAGLR